MSRKTQALLALPFALLLAGQSANAIAADQQARDTPPSLELLNNEEKSLRAARNDVLESLYNQLGKAETAEAAERVASAINKIWTQSGSDTTDLLMERAQVALQERNYDLAITLLQSVSEIDPRFVAGWSQLATVYFIQDRYGDAMHGLRRALALDPRNFRAIEGLGIILRETGNKKAALEVMRRALEINPFLDSAKRVRDELENEVEGQPI